MKSLFGGVGLFILVILGAAIYSSLFIVDETEQALVLQFGEPVDVVQEPGLNFKLPFVQNVSYFDRRVLDLDSPVQEIIAADQERLVVDTFARYQITDPLAFFQTVGSIAGAQSRLSTVLNSATRRVLGEVNYTTIVRDDRASLMARIREQVNRESRSFGMEIVDVRIRRADLPEANSQAIFQRMQTEREREATEIRAQGEEAAQRIRSRADREVTVLVADATREGEQIRGEGDAQRTRIFADAFGRDQEFFSFYRSMQAYEAGFSSGASLVISPDSDFFRYFGDQQGGVFTSSTTQNPTESVAPTTAAAPVEAETQQ
ncbi:MAG: protease modulator HflC [Rhizobiales bacterium]|nr:protease modulator HflC [Hyphomicrobiales bacterium]MBO6697675.1 protease modulator HflC [Hyphomicrobiales bacterium]MBO6736070.1 protease modulator HflC [Hyphomicrobiales bacterium]MBO6912540.1 protease modulator HflC [Hyphomicrobiales bacterium]MBO6956952.1 protease modulator HflC [Hyphomicrobiales bacterium]